MVLRFFLFAVIFLFVSCSDLGERDNPYDPGSRNYRSSSSSLETSSSSTTTSSSSTQQSSSSSISSSVPSSSSMPSSSSTSTPSSSSSTPQSSSSSVSSSSGDFVTGDDGRKYKTVVIGNQTWMAENLNYKVGISKCGDGEALRDTNTTTCDTYGRLYDWATAMQLGSICNDSSCKVDAKHRGVCPASWHIPSSDDWEALMNEVGGEDTAGKYLKAKSWNGEDKYDFSALPGGAGGGANFQNFGKAGQWWSSSQNISNSGYAYSQGMDNQDKAYHNYGTKSYLYSVRCVKD